MSTDTIASDVSLAISGLFVLVAAVLLVLRLRWRKQMRRQPWSLSALADLSRDDVDPNWPLARDELGLPGFMDPHIVKDPVLPVIKDPEGGTHA